MTDQLQILVGADDAIVSSVSLKLADNMSEARWRAIGLELGRITEATQWWIGDWWRFAESRPKGKNWSGDRKELVEAEWWPGPSFQTCMHAGTTARAFSDTCRRRQVLSFEHHRTVQALDADEADDLLDWCEAPLKNGAKKAKTVAQLQDERLRRSNQTILDAALALVESFLAPFIDQPKKKLEQAKAVIVAELKALAAEADNAKAPLSGMALQELARQKLEEIFGTPKQNLVNYANFMHLVKRLESGEFEVASLVVTQPAESIDEDLKAATAAHGKLQCFCRELKTKRSNGR